MPAGKEAPVEYPPRKGPRVRRGSAPALLLEGARELFAERGPYAATTKQIAQRAKVSEDLIFRYYGSKDGLLKEAVFQPLYELLESSPSCGPPTAGIAGAPERQSGPHIHEARRDTC
jgi:hypothetical protein